MDKIDSKETKKKLLINEQQKSYKNAKNCYIFNEKIEDKHAINKFK